MFPCYVDFVILVTFSPQHKSIYFSCHQIQQLQHEKESVEKAMDELGKVSCFWKCVEDCFPVKPLKPYSL